MSSKAKIYLYKEGNECISLTGGWDTEYENKKDTAYVKTNAIVSKNKTNANISISGTYGMALLGTSSRIDTSNFSAIITNTTHSRATSTETSSWSSLCLDDSKNFTTSTLEYQYQGIVGEHTMTVALDENDDRYIFFYVSHGKTYVATGQVSSYDINNVYLLSKENVISINSQNNSSISFSCNNLDNIISITKAEVYINGALSKTYTSNFSNITYSIDNTLCTKGNNQIKIKVTYTQGDDIFETVEEVLTHTSTEKGGIPTTSSLKELIDRQELLTDAIENQKNTLKSILISKNVEVADSENKLSILIDKVNDLENPNANKLWLYKDGVEYSPISSFPLKASHKRGNEDIGQSYIQISCTANNSSVMSRIGLTNLIDLSLYKKIYIEWEFTQSHVDNQIFSELVISSSKDFNTGVISSVSDLTKGKKTSSIDISNINSSAYISVFLSCYGYNSQTVKIYRVWLEK